MRNCSFLLLVVVGCGDSKRTAADVSDGWTRVDTKPGWGGFVDPDGDCKQTWNEGTLVIEVPAKPHELQGDGKRNAPRLVVEKKADFAMNVRVSGKLAPKRQGAAKFAPYHGAGIVLFETETSFLRMERAKIAQPDGKEVTYLNFEEHRPSGSRPIKQLQLRDDESVFLRIERRGTKVIGLMSRDGSSWESLGESSLNAAGPLKVGVVAVNNSDAPFAPEFSDFRFFEGKKP